MRGSKDGCRGLWNPDEVNRRFFLLLGVSLACSPAMLAPAVAEATGSALSAEEVSTLLRMHNEARADVGVGPLTWSPVLAAYAQKWADFLARTGSFQHSGGTYGENLAGGMDVEEAVQSWLAEKASYHGGPIGADWMETGHYTQLVWGGTKRVGCGKASMSEYDIWVCCYDPPGNYEGQRPY